MINYFFKKSMFLILGILCFCIFTAQAGNVQFSDQTFNDADWTANFENCTASSCSFTANQVTSGGNPGAYRQTRHDFTGAGSIVIGHFSNNAVHDLSTGPITSINFSFDAAFFSSSSSFGAVTYEFLLIQDGVIYQAPSSTGGQVGPDSPSGSAPGQWLSFGGTGLIATDFVVSGSPGLHPDFSVSGLPIQFGFRTSNSSGSSATKFTESGIDNWMVDITTEDLVPSLSCSGFEPPMDVPVTVKKNRALPHKAQLFDANDYAITDAHLESLPVIQVIFNSDTSSAVDVTDEALSAGQGDDGNQFVFTEEGKWQFNLKTKNYEASGTYTITMESGDSNEYVIDPTCEATFIVE